MHNVDQGRIQCIGANDRFVPLWCGHSASVPHRHALRWYCLPPRWAEAMACDSELCNPWLASVVSEHITQCHTAGKVQELIDINEPDPLARIMSRKRTVSEPSLLSLSPRPLMEAYGPHRTDNMFNVIVAVVIVDEPPLHPDSSVVSNPFVEEPRLVADHSADTHVVLLPSSRSGYCLRASNRRQGERAPASGPDCHQRGLTLDRLRTLRGVLQRKIS